MITEQSTSSGPYLSSQRKISPQFRRIANQDDNISRAQICKQQTAKLMKPPQVPHLQLKKVMDVAAAAATSTHHSTEKTIKPSPSINSTYTISEFHNSLSKPNTSATQRSQDYRHNDKVNTQKLYQKFSSLNQKISSLTDQDYEQEEDQATRPSSSQHMNNLIFNFKNEQISKEDLIKEIQNVKTHELPEFNPYRKQHSIEQFKNFNTRTNYTTGRDQVDQISIETFQPIQKQSSITIHNNGHTAQKSDTSSPSHQHHHNRLSTLGTNHPLSMQELENETATFNQGTSSQILSRVQSCGSNSIFSDNSCFPTSNLLSNKSKIIKQEENNYRPEQRETMQLTIHSGHQQFLQPIRMSPQNKVVQTSQFMGGQPLAPTTMINSSISNFQNINLSRIPISNQNQGSTQSFINTHSVQNNTCSNNNNESYYQRPQRGAQIKQKLNEMRSYYQQPSIMYNTTSLSSVKDTKMSSKPRRSNHGSPTIYDHTMSSLNKSNSSQNFFTKSNNKNNSNHNNSSIHNHSRSMKGLSSLMFNDRQDRHQRSKMSRIFSATDSQFFGQWSPSICEQSRRIASGLVDFHKRNQIFLNRKEDFLVANICKKSDQNLFTPNINQHSKNLTPNERLEIAKRIQIKHQKRIADILGSRDYSKKRSNSRSSKSPFQSNLKNSQSYGSLIGTPSIFSKSSSSRGAISRIMQSQGYGGIRQQQDSRQQICQQSNRTKKESPSIRSARAAGMLKKSQIAAKLRNIMGK